jgi:hypothetical protein
MLLGQGVQWNINVIEAQKHLTNEKAEVTACGVKGGPSGEEDSRVHSATGAMLHFDPRWMHLSCTCRSYSFGSMMQGIPMQEMRR